MSLYKVLNRLFYNVYLESDFRNPILKSPVNFLIYLYIQVGVHMYIYVYIGQHACFYYHEQCYFYEKFPKDF